MTFKEFLQKVDWEGGFEAALCEYGINPSDITDVPKDIHRELVTAIITFKDSFQMLQNIYDEYYKGEEDED